MTKKPSKSPSKFTLDTRDIKKILGTIFSNVGDHQFGKNDFGQGVLEAITAKTFPDKGRFINPFNHRGWLAYFAKLRPRFQYVRFLGISNLKEQPDVLIERLYVPIFMGTEYVSEDQIEKVEKYAVHHVLEKTRRLVILGDPGAGKSTLINYLTTLFASRQKHPLAASLGQLIPLPFVLRDFKIDRETTFDDLLKQFQEQTFWSDEKLSDGDLQQILRTGQAFIMLDGLDEIGDLEKRKALRRSILEEGIRSYPTCVWMLTSRIVGYEDVPMHTDQKKLLPGTSYDPYADITTKPADIGFDSLFYILPFSDEQIELFATKWYLLREADETEREASIKSLLDAISSSPSVKRLSSNPNLLTMIALIHRVYAQLPSGRALLYDKITEAYLESIDAYRGIQETTVSKAQHRLWLAELAFELQSKRTEEKDDTPEILVPEDQVRKKMQTFLPENVDINQELSYIARRSGLLLPRKPGFYNFVHLSFQEYFAALHLYEGLMSFDCRNATADQVKKYRDETTWHECLIFLFEKLSEHPGASDWLFDHLFPEAPDPTFPGAIHLAAELLGDFHSGLADEKKNMISKFVLQHANSTVDQELLKRINQVHSDIWDKTFGPAIKPYIEYLLSSGDSINPELLLFLQNLHFLNAEELETILDQTVLSELTAETLYFLYPSALRGKSLVKREMIRRMPVELWVVTMLFQYITPVSIFSDKHISLEIKDKSDFLIWVSATKVLTNMVVIKFFLISAGSYFSSERDLDLAWVRARDRVWDISTTLDLDLDPALDLARVLARVLDRALSLARTLDRALDLALSLARTRDLDLVRDLDRDRYRDRTRVLARDLARTLVLANTQLLKLGEQKPAQFQVAAVCLSGDDTYELNGLNGVPSKNTPLWLIFQHLSLLLLGKGGPEDWETMQSLVDNLLDPEWMKSNLSFIEPDEMRAALRFLGLRMDDGKALFEKMWFTEGHPLAPALNAKPSEFAKAIDALLAKSSVEG